MPNKARHRAHRKLRRKVIKQRRRRVTPRFAPVVFGSRAGGFYQVSPTKLTTGL